MRKVLIASGIVAGLVLLVVLLFVGGSAYGRWHMDLVVPEGGGLGAGLLALGSIALVVAAGVVATVVLVGNLLPRTRGRVWPWALAELAENDEFRYHTCRRTSLRVDCGAV